MKSWVGAGVALVLSAANASGQAPAERAALARFRDSLSAITDSGAFADPDRMAVTPTAASELQALAQLRRGLVHLRAGQLGSAAHYRRAEGAFARAASLAPAWPYPPYGRALAKYAISESQRANPLELGTVVGVGALDDAIGALEAALALDPDFEPALRDLARFGARLHRPDFWSRALRALRQTGAESRRDPAVLLALGRTEREIGDRDSAVAAFRTYLDRGGSRGLGLLELARMFMAFGRPGADTLYFAGAAFDDSTAVASYRNDIAVILSDSQLTEFDAARGTARADWLRQLWARRDAIELRAPGERLAEHYRRLAYARRHFGLVVTRRYYPPECRYRSGSMDFDDRGIVYIRHGEPTKRVRTFLFGLPPNESWRYDRPDGTLLLHFGAGAAVDDYRLLPGVLDVYTSCSYVGFSSPATPVDVYQSREELDTLYSRLVATYGTSAAWRYAREERRISAMSMAVGTATDSYERRFARTLPVAVRLTAVGRDGNRTLLHVTYALGGNALTPEAGQHSRYLVRLRLVLVDQRGAVGASVDTAVVLETRAPVPAGSLLFGRFAVAVPPGTWHYRLALQQGDSAGQVLPRDSVVVPRFDQSSLTLSDPVLGWRPIGVSWERAADTVFFSPFRSYYRDAALELYYEVYGMAPGSTYQTELIVSERQRGRANGPARVQLKFDDVASAPTTSGRRTLDLRQFKPGAYWLDIIVTDARHRRESRRTWFEVKAHPGPPQ